MCRRILRGTGVLKFLFFCGFSFTLLSLNFYTNFLDSAEQSWFASFDRSSERCIMGRLIKSRQDGILSSGGLAVIGVTPEDALKDPLLNFFNDRFDNFKAYTENLTVKNFAPPYYSQICGQGIIFSILDKIISYSPSIKLRIFHGIAAVLTAFVVMIIIAWFSVEFGFFVGLTVLVFALLSQWLTVFARNLWWSTWAFYLPMALVMLYFLCRRNRYTQYIKLGSVVFFSVLIKTIFNGYEYITTTLIMMVVPFVYYGFLDKESFASFLNGLIKITMSAGLAIGLSMCILSFQIASVSGNFLDGFNHIKYSFLKRTHATPNNQMNPLIIETMQAPTLSVVRNYLHGGFCSIDLSVLHSNSSEPHARYYVSYARLILFFVVMTLVVLLSAKRYAVSSKDSSLYALVIASWFSILAPLSWFVIFKGHSHAHLALNFIVWQMPFTFFGAAITGLALRNGVSWLWSSIRGTRPTA